MSATISRRTLLALAGGTLAGIGSIASPAARRITALGAAFCHVRVLTWP